MKLVLPLPPELPSYLFPEGSTRNQLLNQIHNWYKNKGAYYLKYTFLFPNFGCKYYPTCSEYSFLAIKKHGPIIGIAKSIWRVLRCNPYSKGGIDYP